MCECEEITTIDVVWEISDMVLYNLNKVLNCLHCNPYYVNCNWK